MNETQRLVIATALRKLFKENHFSICTVDDCLKIMGIPKGGDSYQLLHALHCVDYADMPRELAERLPQLLTDVFNGINISDLMNAAEPAKYSNGATALQITRRQA